MKRIFLLLCPPVFVKLYHKLNSGRSTKKVDSAEKNHNPDKQDLDLYWDPAMAKLLDEWGMDNTWNEIQLILSTCQGKVLDIACGTGITIEILKKFNHLEIHGCDISDFLIRKAAERGIPKEHLLVCDATKTPYKNNEFVYSYSIGSLEHFTIEGIDLFIKESARITEKASFHMIPTSKSGKDEGWTKTLQSFFNNSDDWWMEKFKKHYSGVIMINSKWNDTISYGRWFLCYK